jgi:hypothetical protein
MRTITSLSVALFIALLTAAAQQPTAAPQAPAAAPHDTVRGAIRSIDAQAGLVEVSSGVGYAIRVVQLRVPAGVPITDRESGQTESIKLGELRLGDVVRASFGGQAAPFLAYTIERVGSMETGVSSRP